MSQRSIRYEAPVLVIDIITFDTGDLNRLVSACNLLDQSVARLCQDFSCVIVSKTDGHRMYQMDVHQILESQKLNHLPNTLQTTVVQEMNTAVDIHPLLDSREINQTCDTQQKHVSDKMNQTICTHQIPLSQREDTADGINVLNQKSKFNSRMKNDLVRSWSWCQEGILDIQDRIVENYKRPPGRFERKFKEYIPMYNICLPCAPAFRVLSAKKADEISQRLYSHSANALENRNKDEVTNQKLAYNIQQDLKKHKLHGEKKNISRDKLHVYENHLIKDELHCEKDNLSNDKLYCVKDNDLNLLGEKNILTRDKYHGEEDSLSKQQPHCERGNQAKIKLDCERGNQAKINKLDSEKGNEAKIKLDSEKGNEAKIKLDSEKGNEAKIKLDSEKGNEAKIKLDSEKGNEAKIKLDSEKGNEAKIKLDSEKDNEEKDKPISDKDNLIKDKFHGGKVLTFFDSHKSYKEPSNINKDKIANSQQGPYKSTKMYNHRKSQALAGQETMKKYCDHGKQNISRSKKEETNRKHSAWDFSSEEQISDDSSQFKTMPNKQSEEFSSDNESNALCNNSASTGSETNMKHQSMAILREILEQRSDIVHYPREISKQHNGDKSNPTLTEKQIRKTESYEERKKEISSSYKRNEKSIESKSEFHPSNKKVVLPLKRQQINKKFQLTSDQNINMLIYQLALTSKLCQNPPSRLISSLYNSSNSKEQQPKLFDKSNKIFRKNIQTDKKPSPNAHNSATSKDNKVQKTEIDKPFPLGRDIVLLNRSSSDVDEKC
ncbi:hypothetical protein Btru_030459 [Bulinus truncatus]|nr:hypothetical protein Btru_030459 [Bulinus truncatus]